MYDVSMKKPTTYSLQIIGQSQFMFCIFVFLELFESNDSLNRFIALRNNLMNLSRLQRLVAKLWF